MRRIIVMIMVLLIVTIFTRIMPLMVSNVLSRGDTLKVRLEFAYALAFRQRRDLHVDVTSSHLRVLIHMAHGIEVTLDLPSQLMPEFLVSHLTTTELKLDADLVSFRKEVFRVSDLDAVVVRINADTELHFLHLATLVVLVGFLLVLLLNVLVLAVIDNFAHRRFGIGGHFHQIQTALLRHTKSLMRRHHTELSVILAVHDTDFWRTNAFIDASLIRVTT